MRSVLISVHIPKCGGSSFNAVLEAMYGDALWRNYGVAFSRRELRPELIPAGTRCIHGHFRADTFDGCFDQPALITWLRHPVERVVSSYYYLQRHPDMADRSCRDLHERRLTLRQFADDPWMQNGIAGYVAGRRVSAFDFVGIAERFDESLDLFHRLFGGRRGPAPRHNRNPARGGERYELSAADYDFVLERNQADLALFEAAQAQLDQQLRQAAREDAPVRRVPIAEQGWVPPAWQF